MHAELNRVAEGDCAASWWHCAEQVVLWIHCLIGYLDNLDIFIQVRVANNCTRRMNGAAAPNMAATAEMSASAQTVWSDMAGMRCVMRDAMRCDAMRDAAGPLLMPAPR